MANPQLKSPTNPHFFQPLVPGFHTHLTIPVAFFSKHLQGKYEQESVILKSDASDKTWEVKLDGKKLTQGWKDFATSHSLRIGDVIIFKHEGDMVFHVTTFGPSCCEIQYTEPPHTIKEEDNIDDDDEDNETRLVLKKKSLIIKTDPESYNYCFVVQVTDSNIQRDTLDLPVEAARSNALNRKRYYKIMLVNDKGLDWTLSLKLSSVYYYITGGWKSFCHENKHKVGDLITFNLVGDGETTPLLCVCPEQECLELINEYKEREEEKKKPEKRSIWKPSSSAEQNRFVTITLTRYNLQNSKLILPTSFVKFHGLDKHEKIVLMDKDSVGKRWVKLINDGPNRGKKGLGQGWKPFCEANDVMKIGECFELELIWEDYGPVTPVLKFCHKVNN